MTETLEVTITHNLEKKDAADVADLFRLKWIALDFGRKGQNPEAYTGHARTAVKLFHTMKQNGAAVIAAYKGATTKPSQRLVGCVEAGVEFEDLNGLLCLPLSKTRVVDSSASFLGNLAPRQCTVQHCGNRAKGRLAAFVNGKVMRDVGALHHHDVELLVTNYLIAKRLCTCVWSGARTFEDIDHAGWTTDGRELLAQTTVSESEKLVKTKAKKLRCYARHDRVLHFFGPAKSAKDCPSGIAFHSIETVFSELDQMDGGKWLINGMFGATVTTDEPQ